MIVFAHLGHWYSAFGFLVPAALVIGWIRFQARRERRRVQFAEDWTLQLRGGVWRLESIDPVAPRQRRHRRSHPPRTAASPAPERSGS